MFWMIVGLMLLPALFFLLRPLLSPERSSDAEGRVPHKVRNALLAAVVAAAVAGGGIATYLRYSTGYEHLAMMQELEAGMIELLDLIDETEQRLAAAPDDADGWRLLVQAREALGQYSEAVRAYEQLERLDALAGTEDQAAYAEALILADTDLHKARELLVEVTKTAPDNPVALYLLGSLAFKESAYEEAVKRWQALYQLMPVTEQVWRDELLRRISEAEVLAQNRSETREPEAAAANPEFLEVTVVLDAELKKQAMADDAVFIHVNAADGPPMPLAVRRVTVSELPQTVRFSDDDAMMPAFRLSQFDAVEVFARVSKSGLARRQPGDLLGRSGIVSLDTVPEQLTVTIDKIVRDVP